MVQRLYRILRLTAMLELAWCGIAAPAAAQSTHDHTPRHGGVLRPAAQDTLHIEAVWPMQRIVRVFVYDAGMRPIPPDRLLAIRGRIVIAGRDYALMPSSEGYLQARIPSLATPAQMTVQLALTPGGEDQFDLVFPTYTVAPEALDFVLPPTPVPDTLPGVLAALRDDGRDAQSIVDNGALTFAYAPAVRVRDRLLALDAYLPTLAPVARAWAQAAVLSAVRAAWLLHISADAGISPAQIRASVGVLTDAIDDVIDAFGGTAR